MMMKLAEAPVLQGGREHDPGSAGTALWSVSVVIASRFPQILAEYYAIKQCERKSKYMFTGY